MAAENHENCRERRQAKPHAGDSSSRAAEKASWMRSARSGLPLAWAAPARAPGIEATPDHVRQTITRRYPT